MSSQQQHERPVSARPVSLVNVSELRHIEGFGPRRVAWLRERIEAEGRWTVPLRLECTQFLVMDGQHRMEVARQLGLARVPCQLYDYSEVEVWSLRSSYIVTPSEIIRRCRADELYPYKTAKHRFPDGTTTCDFTLADLRSVE